MVKLNVDFTETAWKQLEKFAQLAGYKSVAEFIHDRTINMLVSKLTEPDKRAFEKKQQEILDELMEKGVKD